jgi:ribonuclease VapC
VDAEIVPFTSEHAALARDAWRRFGKGRHPAGLNLGDCFAYALAKSRDEPLLFKGEDFARTDVKAAI